MSTLMDYCLNSTFQACIFNLVTDMASELGAGAFAYVFLYSMIILGGVAGAVVLHSITYGLVTFIGLHTLIMILGSVNVLPLPAGYYQIGAFMYVAVVLAFITIWKRRQ